MKFSDTDTYQEIQHWTNTRKYANSIFHEFSLMSSHGKGAKGEHLVTELCQHLGYEVGKRLNSDHDRVIDGRKAEIKLSFLWENDTFTWQQIRPESDWDDIYFVSVYIDRIDVYMTDKASVLACEQLRPQHTGSKGEETYWLQSVLPEDIDCLRYIGTIDGE